MSNSSLKKDIIYGLANSTEIDQLKENYVVLLTASGIIKGKISKLGYPEDASPKNLLNTLVHSISEEYREHYSIPEDTLLPGNDGGIALEDVTILLNSGSNYVLPHLVVFFDQIIGVTIGNIDSKMV